MTKDRTGTTRAEFVAEARSWIATPYRRRGTIKRVGADCGSFIGCVLAGCGLIDKEKFYKTMKEIEALSDDWFLHKAEGKYVELMERFVAKIKSRMTYGLPGEPPGNILLMQTNNAKRPNHGGIVTAWPKLVHCIYGGVEEVNITFNPLWSYHEVSVYDPWAMNIE